LHRTIECERATSGRGPSGLAPAIRQFENTDQLVCQVQIPLRFDPIDNNLIRTGYYYLPSKWQSKALPVMVLFHGLEGYGLDTIQAGSGSNFQVCAGIDPRSLLSALLSAQPPQFCCSLPKLKRSSMLLCRPLHLLKARTAVTAVLSHLIRLLCRRAGLPRLSSRMPMSASSSLVTSGIAKHEHSPSLYSRIMIL